MMDFSDYKGEMHDIDDATAEELLTGRLISNPGELGRLARLLQKLRISATSTAPAPSPELRAVLERGLPTNDKLAVAPVRPRGGTAGGRARRRAGLAAKVGVSVTVAAGSLTTAAAAGVLPEKAETAVAEAVERLTPFQLPNRSDAGARSDAPARTDVTGASGQGVEVLLAPSEPTMPSTPSNYGQTPSSTPSLGGQGPKGQPVETRPTREAPTTPREDSTPHPTPEPDGSGGGPTVEPPEADKLGDQVPSVDEPVSIPPLPSL
jgi:hypothetical protein